MQEHIDWGHQELYRRMKECKSRKAVPQGRSVKELWQLTLEPYATGSQVGITLNQIYEDGKLLRRWQVAQTAQLDKNNGKPGPKAVRLINIMCPLGKVFFKKLWETKDRKLYVFLMGIRRTGGGSRRYWLRMWFHGN